MAERHPCPDDAPEPCHREDLALVQACIAGDRASWSRLVTTWERTLHHAITATLRRLGEAPDPSLVEDLQAEIVMDLVKDDCHKLRRYSGRSQLGRWLRVVAGNHVIDHLRTHRRHISLEADDPLSAQVRNSLTQATASAEDQLATAQRVARVRQALVSLPAADQRFVALYWGEGWSFARIAEAMGTTIDAIYARKRRVRKRLQALTAQADGPDEGRRHG